MKKAHDWVEEDQLWYPVDVAEEQEDKTEERGRKGKRETRKP